MTFMLKGHKYYRKTHYLLEHFQRWSRYLGCFKIKSRVYDLNFLATHLISLHRSRFSALELQEVDSVTL